MPTYDPDAKTKYFVDATEFEDWLREQYDVPGFNVPLDLQEFASPDGAYMVSVDGDLSDRDRNELDDFLEAVEERGVVPDTRFMTDRFLNRLAADGHIPEGEYVVEMTF